MPTSLTNYSNGSVISSSNWTSDHNSVAEYINFTGKSSDHSSSRFVHTRHLPPRVFFVLNPAPRAEGQTSDIHWRHHTDDPFDRALYHRQNTGAVTAAIPGMSATFKQKTPRSAVLQTLGSLYVYETGGAVAPANSEHRTDALIATLQLYVNGTAQDGTLREIYAGSRWHHHGSRKQISFCHESSVALTQGVHNVSYRITLNTTGYLGAVDSFAGGNLFKAKHVYVEARNFVCDVLTL